MKLQDMIIKSQSKELSTGVQQNGGNLDLIIQFYAGFLDLDMQILYTELKERININKRQDQQQIDWAYQRLPILRTPLNTQELVEKKSLQMIIWGKASDISSDGKRPFTLIG